MKRIFNHNTIHNRRLLIRSLMLLAILLAIASCSSTSHLEEGEQLFIGLEKIDWHGEPQGHNSHLLDTESEVEAALATAPNGALFGSSYYRTLFPYGLWVYNKWGHKEDGFSKWMVSTFGKAPVLMRNVNPSLRASVAKSVLQNNGYFNGDITFDTKDYGKRDSMGLAKKQKIQYHVYFGHLYTLDTISFSNFPTDIYQRIFMGDKKEGSTSSLQPGDPFSVANLENERTRIYRLLRNHGFYNYQTSYTSYLADTIMTPGKVHLQLHLADSLPEDALRKWVIGSTTVNIRREIREQPTDSVNTRFLKIRYARKPNDKRLRVPPPIRARVILADTKLRPGMLFSQDAYEESINALASKGVFSSIDITFKKRYEEDGSLHLVADTIGVRRGNDSLDTRAGAGVLDMTVTAVLDKPYDVTFEANGTGKTSGRVGPGVRVGLTKRNAFHGGESLTISAGANYEFQVGGQNMGNSYDFDLSTDLTFPRLLWPKFFNRSKEVSPNTNRRFRRRWYTTPTTIISLSGETIRRAGFFRRNILSGEFSYIFQPTETSIHGLSPLILTYGRTFDVTDDYLDKVKDSPTALVALEDEMTPKIRYTYTYNSPKAYRNPIFFQGTVSEAGNICDLGAMAFTGKKFNDKGKKLFGIAFSQFLKFEADIKKTWTIGGLGSKSSFVIHFYGGVLTAYGNSTWAPFSEQFYIGGVNDLRGFSMRSVGPGAVHYDDRTHAYLEHNGDCKAILNLEYRPHLFGSLFGALFIDAGNVWHLRHSSRQYYIDKGDGDPAKKDVALDAGVGLRYDLDFFVVRIDWGFALHTPYEGGFFKQKFRNAQVLNFAIGYPF